MGTAPGQEDIEDLDVLAESAIDPAPRASDLHARASRNAGHSGLLHVSVTGSPNRAAVPIAALSAESRSTSTQQIPRPGNECTSRS